MLIRKDEIQLERKALTVSSVSWANVGTFVNRKIALVSNTLGVGKLYMINCFCFFFLGGGEI